jgi:hypothetical protein
VVEQLGDDGLCASPVGREVVLDVLGTLKPYREEVKGTNRLYGG